MIFGGTWRRRPSSMLGGVTAAPELDGPRRLTAAP
jgi:hypothetical protein